MPEVLGSTLPSALSSVRTRLRRWSNSAACRSPPVCLLSADVGGRAHPAPRVGLRTCRPSGVSAHQDKGGSAGADPSLSQPGNHLCFSLICFFFSSNVLHCLLFFSITRMAIFIPFSSYYFHIVNFFFFEFPPHSQPSPLRESLKRKEHIIQTLHITNKGLGGSE